MQGVQRPLDQWTLGRLALPWEPGATLQGAEPLVSRAATGVQPLPEPGKLRPLRAQQPHSTLSSFCLNFSFYLEGSSHTRLKVLERNKISKWSLDSLCKR